MVVKAGAGGGSHKYLSTYLVHSRIVGGIYIPIGIVCYYMALLLNTKNSFSKKAAFEYTHTYSSTIGDMSDLNPNA